MESRAVAEWACDGFLHPPATLDHEFVDVDEFLRLPVEGLPEIIQFARILVDGVPHLVFGLGGSAFRMLLENAMRDRFGLERCAFVASVAAGLVTVYGAHLTAGDGAAVAVTQFRCAWDETAEIEVRDDRHAFSVQVTYSDERYATVVRSTLST